MAILQSGRFCTLSTALGAEAFLVRRVQIEEGISRTFLVQLDLESEQLDFAAGDLLGTGALIMIETANGTRQPFHGLVTRFERRGRTPRSANFRIELRPWLWLLEHRTDCRIFQGLTVPQIVAKVFQGLGKHDCEFRTRDTYPVREYCVQYRESDHDFVCRLLEEEGLYFFFEHAESRHVLVIADSTEVLPTCPEQSEVKFLALDNGQFREDAVREFAMSESIGSGAVTVKNYNFEDPGNALEAQMRGDRGAALEAYDYHPRDFNSHAGGSRLAKLRMQGREVAAVRAQGVSDCRSMRSGYRFKLSGHPSPEVNGVPFLLTALRHDISQPSAFSAAPGDEGPVYRNEFECVPADLVYRPPLETPLPRIRGPQTAVVVGPAGEEIWVDKYGRIKVQFHWDRLGKRDEDSSCWVRVAQLWAGKQWGGMVHPRIGDEVVIEFLEGDPDRPIVTGSVYNARQTLPYALPANKTQWGLKSRSTPGGSADNFNELRFEDKKGEEHVYLQAEKNMQFLVKNDHSGSVGGGESVSVGKNRSARVGANETTTIGESRENTVGKNAVETIGTDRTCRVGSNDDLDVGGAMSVRVGGDSRVDIASASSVTVGSTSSENVLGLKSTMVGGACLLTVGGALNTAVGLASFEEIGLIKKIIAGSSVEIVCGSASFKMESGGKITMQGGELSLIASGAVHIKGATIDLN